MRGRTDLDSEYVERITDTVDALNQLLDVDEPFTFVVDDPTGSSVIKPSAGVEILNTANAASKILSYDTPPAEGFTLDHVELLQTFGHALKALPGLNNANTFNADQFELEELIEQAIVVVGCQLTNQQSTWSQRCCVLAQRAHT